MMLPRTLLPLLLGTSLALSGCAASLAAGALGAAVRSTQGEDKYHDDAAIKLAAGQACRTHAAQHGEVHIIDLEQRSARKVVVWGTVTAAKRQSFECTYTDKVAAFRLRPID